MPSGNQELGTGLFTLPPFPSPVPLTNWLRVCSAALQKPLSIHGFQHIHVLHPPANFTLQFFTLFSVSVFLIFTQEM